MLHDNFIKTAKQESHEFKALLNILSSLNLHTKEGRKLLCVLNNIIDYYINREVEYSDDVKMPIVYWLSGNFWLVSFKISYLCLPLFYETRTTPSCHPSGCAYRQL